MKAFSSIFNTFWGEFPSACRTKNGKDTHWTPTWSWTKCHPQWGGKSQPDSLLSRTDFPGQNHSKYPSWPSETPLPQENSQEEAHDSLVGEMCQGCIAGDDGNQGRSPKITFNWQKTWARQGKQSTQVSTGTHTHPLTPRASKNVIYSTIFKNVIPLMDSSICSLPNSKLLTL